MFDRFKKLLGSADSDPAADAPEADADAQAARAVKRRVSGPDKVTLSGASSVAIPEAAQAAQATAVNVPEGALTPRAAVPMTFGLRDLIRAKPMQHFVVLADEIQPSDQYRFHDIGGRYYEVYKNNFPALDRFTSLTFWGFNFQGDHTVQIRVLDVEDNVIAELAEPYRFRLDRPSDTHETRTSWQVVFPAPGTYYLVVETDGRPTAVAPVYVVRSV